MTPPNYKRQARRLKLLGHPERLRLLDLLRRGPECVCHLEAALGRPQPYISQQVRTLHRAGLLRATREGLNIYYRISDAEVLAWLEAILGPVSAPEASGQLLAACSCPKCQSLSVISIQ